MLVFLVLCAFLRTLRGDSVLPSHAYGPVDAVDMIGLMPRNSPAPSDDGDQQFRTVYSIVKSCLLTIFACVWTSAHPNIDGPRDSWWTCMAHKVVVMLYAVLAPEIILYWALRQHRAAKTIAADYNKQFASFGVEETETSLWLKVVGGFRPLARATTWRGDGQSWTMTHGFFIQMGGFILYDNGYPREVLSYRRLTELLRNKAIDAPTITKRDLQDRSKGDSISKAFVVFQTTWFVLQCIARAGKHLPLSELEVLTLAFAVLNAAIYAVWWNKPQGVGMAICIPLKRTEIRVGTPTTPLTGEEQRELGGLSHPESANLPPIPLESPDEQSGEPHGWLRGKYRDAVKTRSTPAFTVQLPKRLLVVMVRQLNKMDEDVTFKQNVLRVPIFYASDGGGRGSLIASGACGVVFGAIHLLAWGSEFPSHGALWLWRVSAIVMTAFAASLVLLQLLGSEDTHLGMQVIRFCVGFVFGLLQIPYIAARFIVVVVALWAIRDPSQGVLRDVSWASRIPHF